MNKNSTKAETVASVSLAMPQSGLSEEVDEPPSCSDCSCPDTEEFEEPPSMAQSALSSEPIQQTSTPLFLLPEELTPTQLFRIRFFPGISNRRWNDWSWQVRNRIRSLEGLERVLELSDEERKAVETSGSMLPMGITPYYLSLISPDDPTQPLRRTMIPSLMELIKSPGEASDPLHEEGDSPVPGLVHRYPDRVLFLVTDFCSAYCRYCTRSRTVGHDRITPDEQRLNNGLTYIREHPEIRDVLVSGGDPLTLKTERLDWILTHLRQIPHVEIIRIGTKAPAVFPQRITAKLTRMLRKHHPLMMSLHFTHPDECTPEAHAACDRLADAGILLGSQTVLLKGINDNVETMAELMHNLLKMRVRPYYLYQCDPILGSSHFRTPVAKGLEIIRGMRGFTSGYAVPTYVIDAPGGGGKIPLLPDSVAGRDGDDLILRNYEGKTFRYPDPVFSKNSTGKSQNLPFEVDWAVAHKGEHRCTSD